MLPQVTCVSVCKYLKSNAYMCFPGFISYGKIIVLMYIVGSDFIPTVGGNQQCTKNRTGLIVGVVVSSVVVGLFLLFGIFYVRRKSRKDDEGKEIISESNVMSLVQSLVNEHQHIPPCSIGLDA